MTLDQIKRIQLNNYCSEHDSKGNQFDYEAKGYKDAIDARYWDLIEKRSLNQLKNNARIPIKPDMSIDTVDTEKKPVTADFIAKEIEFCDIQLSVLKTFNKWRYISNEILIKTC